MLMTIKIFIQMLVSILVFLFLLGWGVLHFISLLLDKLESVQSDVAKALIAASATILVAAITMVAGKIWEQRLKIRDEIRAKKIPIYEKHIHTFFEILYAEKFTGKPADPHKQVRAFAEFAELAIIWGSSDVIKRWAAFREAAEVAKTPDEKLDILENLFIAIRRDIGNDVRHLAKRDLIRLFVNDIPKTKT